MANGENLGAKFTIDITDLKAGLAQANRLIRESESEFQEAAAGMNDWENSAEGLTKRTKTLSKQVELQQEKVEALVKEKKRIIKTMKAEGKSNEEIEKAVDGVNKSIRREGKQLDTLKKKLKQSEKNLEKYEDSLDDTADALEDVSDESKDTRKATDKLTDEIKAQKTQLEKLAKEYSDAVLEQGEMSDEAQNLKKQIKSLNGELANNEKKLSGATKGIGGLGDGAGDLGGGFNLAKVAVGGFVAGGLTALVGAAGNAVSSMMELAESTRETRTNMAKLETAFGAAGFEADTASETFKTLYGILGDEGQATEAAAHLAKLVDTEKDLADWTTIATGVYAEFGDSLPIESLTEAANETAKTGTVTGSLADALNWSTLSSEGWATALGGNKKALKAFAKETKNGASAEDAFNAALAACSNEQERQQLITSTLTTMYSESAEAFSENNAAVIAGQEATADYNTAMANLGGQMEPLNTAFTNLKTTLIEAVTPAVGGLATATANLITNIISAEEETDLLSETQRAAVTAAQEVATAYWGNMEAADAMADAGLANVEYGEKILEQIPSLVDGNGKVKEGEEERAKFLLGEYNNALGTEYTKLSQIVDANGQIKDSVYDVIEAKKVQILMEAYEDSYREAVMKVAEVEKSRAIQSQEIAAQEAVAAEARKAADDAQIALSEKVANVRTEADGRALLSEQRYVQGLQIEAQKQEGILAEKQAAYDETEGTLISHYQTIAGYENANAALLAGNTEEALGHLEKLGDGYNGTASSVQQATEEKLEIARQDVINTRNHAEWVKQAYEDGVDGVTEEMVATAEQAAKDAETEFKKIGGNITDGIGVGAEEKKPSLTTKLKSIMSAAVAAAKAAAGIESPSTVFRDEVGKYMGEGIAVGIDRSTADVVKSVDNQVNSALKAYDVGKINDAISGGVNIHGGKKNGSGGLASGNSGGVTVYQTNNYANSHSRYEIYKSKQATEAAVRLALGGA